MSYVVVICPNKGDKYGTLEVVEETKGDLICWDVVSHKKFDNKEDAENWKNNAVWVNKDEIVDWLANRIYYTPEELWKMYVKETYKVANIRAAISTGFQNIRDYIDNYDRESDNG